MSDPYYERINELGEKIKEQASANSGKINDRLNEATKFLGDATSAAILHNTVLKGLWTKYGSKILKNVPENIKNNLNLANDAEPAEEGATQAENVFSGIRNAVSTVARNAVETGTNLVENAVQTGSNVVRDAVQTGSNVVRDAVESGSNVVRNIARETGQGIEMSNFANAGTVASEATNDAIGEIGGLSEDVAEPFMTNALSLFRDGTDALTSTSEIPASESLMARLISQGESQGSSMTMDQLAPLREMMRIQRAEAPQVEDSGNVADAGEQVGAQATAQAEVGAQAGEQAGEIGAQVGEQASEIGSEIGSTVGNVAGEVGNVVQSVGNTIGKVAGDVLPAVKSTLATLTEDSTAGDETPFGLILTAGLGVATLFTEFGELFEKHSPTVSFQSAPIAGI